MDANDLFRRLAVGAKFNFKRFEQDAKKLKIQHPPNSDNRDRVHNKTLTLEDRVHSKDSESTSAKKRKADDFEEGSDDTFSDDNSSYDDMEESSEEEVEENSVEESEREEHEELCLLGNIKSKPDSQITSKMKERNSSKKMKKCTTDKISALKLEELNRLKRVNRLHSVGTDVPNPISTFQQLQAEYGMNQQLLKNTESAGYTTPTPIQMQAIPVMMARREILACAPTGSGKTAAFILPVLHHLKEPQNKGFRAVVLSPTRELAKQTHREFLRLGEGRNFRVFFFDKVHYAIAAGKKFSWKYDILVTTPNKLVFMLNHEKPVKLDNVEWLIVDESDKLFEEGKMGFRDQLAAIYHACSSKNVRRAMFSATFAHDVEQWCKLNFDNVIHVYIGDKNTATESVEQELLFVGSESGKLLAVRNMVKKGIEPPVLIFLQSKERAKELFKELIYDGINVDVIHADRTQLERDNVVNSFRAGRIWVLLCTELMGRGIDFKGVNLVINYDFPNSAISYIHRIGRTGRAGRKGRAVTFFTEDDGINLRSISNVMKNAGCPVPEYMLKMKRPNKTARRKLAKIVPERETISTQLKFKSISSSQDHKRPRFRKSEWLKSKQEPTAKTQEPKKKQQKTKKKKLNNVSKSKSGEKNNVIKTTGDKKSNVQSNKSKHKSSRSKKLKKAS